MSHKTIIKTKHKSGVKALPEHHLVSVLPSDPIECSIKYNDGIIRGENPDGLTLRELVNGAWDKDAKRPTIRRS